MTVEIEVWAGPDDFAFERDRYLWKMWVKQNITRSGYSVIAHKDDAYKAIIVFDDPKWEMIFKLKAPEYIDASMVICDEPWVI